MTRSWLAMVTFGCMFSVAAVEGCGGSDETGPGGSPATTATATSSGADSGGGSTGSMGGAGGTGLNPPTPEFPEIIGTLTVALTTDIAPTSGTDSGIEVCLTETDCFSLDTPEVNDRQLGETDELHIANVNLPRSMVDRVVLRSTSDPNTNNDRFTPSCLHLRFDGEPVYCNDQLDVHIGTGTSAKEVISYSDSDGLHQNCRSCWVDDTITHGPMVGTPRAEGTPVWLRADATRVVGLRLGPAPDLSQAPIVAWALPDPSHDFTVELMAPLATGEAGFYRVEVAGDTSQPARPIRGRLSEAADNLRFIYGSCTTYQPSPAFATARALAPDLFLFIGDNHYGNVQHVDAHRWHYRRMRRIKDRADMMADVPTMAIWDDHDFLANNSHGACARREHALQGFTEYWANPNYGTSETPGVFFRHREGPMELFALDCRMYRPDVGDPGSGCELDPSPPSLPMASGLLGPSQTEWLLDAVDSSNAPFKLLACGSRFTAEGSLDSWASFPAALSALHDELDARQVEGVVFLSGDIHRSLFRTNPRPSGYPIPELTSSPMARPSPATPACSLEAGVSFCYRDNSFMVLDITPAELTATLHAESGAILHSETISRSSLSY